MNNNLIQIDECDGGRKGTIKVSYSTLVEQLGLPNRKDDPVKIDASWGVKHSDGRKLFVWNYKNGPAYTGKGTIEDIDVWSYDGDDSLVEELFGRGAFDLS